MTMSGPNPGPQPLVSNPQLALIVYILYFAGYLTGLMTSLIGVIIAHIQVGTAEPMLASHYRFQIRTFWIGALYLVVGGILVWVLIGFLVLLWWFVWSLVRNIKGILALNENRPIADPGSWMFG
jgi:uncharacterized membrane protein